MKITTIVDGGKVTVLQNEVTVYSSEVATPPASGGEAPVTGQVAGIYSVPPIKGDLEDGNDKPVSVSVGANSPIGLTFSVREDTARDIKWAAPGSFDRTSWAIFKGPDRVLGVDNQLVSGTMGWQVTSLSGLEDGDYVFAVAINKDRTLDTQYNQR